MKNVDLPNLKTTNEHCQRDPDLLAEFQADISKKMKYLHLDYDSMLDSLGELIVEKTMHIINENPDYRYEIIGRLEAHFETVVYDVTRKSVVGE